MRTSKPTYDHVELYDDKGHFVIIGLPEYLSDVRGKLEKSSIPHSEHEFVTSQRAVYGNPVTASVTMFELRVPHGDEVIAWFEVNKSRFQSEDMDHVEL